MQKFNYKKIEWDEGNIFKNEIKHNLKYFEIEESIENNCKCIIPHKQYTDRKVILGYSDSGRYLFISYQEKQNGIIRPIHCRDMTIQERLFMIKTGDIINDKTKKKNYETYY